MFKKFYSAIDTTTEEMVQLFNNDTFMKFFEAYLAINDIEVMCADSVDKDCFYDVILAQIYLGLNYILKK